MRVFLTGATGYIGGAVAAALAKRGHEVAALVRPESDSKRLRELGAVIIAGDAGSLPGLTDTIAKYDVTVHTAFNMSDPVNSDKNVVDALTAAKPFFVYTSGVWVLGPGKSDETSAVNPLPVVAWRPGHEQRVLKTGRGAVIRPGCVYGGKQSLIAQWFSAADQKQPLQIVGDGKNRWAMVNLRDLADCYVRVIENRVTGVFHAVDDTHDTLDDLAKAVAPNGSIEHVPADAARQKMGPFVDALVVDQVVSSERTRKALSWNPSRTFKTSIDEQRREFKTASS